MLFRCVANAETTSMMMGNMHNCHDNMVGEMHVPMRGFFHGGTIMFLPAFANGLLMWNGHSDGQYFRDATTGFDVDHSTVTF